MKKKLALLSLAVLCFGAGCSSGSSGDDFEDFGSDGGFYEEPSEDTSNTATDAITDPAVVGDVVFSYSMKYKYIDSEIPSQKPTLYCRFTNNYDKGDVKSVSLTAQMYDAADNPLGEEKVLTAAQIVKDDAQDMGILCQEDYSEKYCVVKTITVGYTDGATAVVDLNKKVEKNVIISNDTYADGAQIHDASKVSAAVDLTEGEEGSKVVFTLTNNHDVAIKTAYASAKLYDKDGDMLTKVSAEYGTNEYKETPPIAKGETFSIETDSSEKKAVRAEVTNVTILYEDDTKAIINY